MRLSKFRNDLHTLIIFGCNYQLHICMQASFSLYTLSALLSVGQTHFTE